MADAASFTVIPDPCPPLSNFTPKVLGPNQLVKFTQGSWTAGVWEDEWYPQSSCRSYTATWHYRNLPTQTWSYGGSGPYYSRAIGGSADMDVRLTLTHNGITKYFIRHVDNCGTDCGGDENPW